MNLHRLLRMRRLRAAGPLPGKDEWKPLPLREKSLWERIILEGTMLVLPAASVLLVPSLAGKLRSGVQEKYGISIVEKEIPAPEEPPPVPPAPVPPLEKEKKKQERKHVKTREKEEEEEELEEEEEEEFNPYGIDEGSLASGPGSGFAVPVGDSLMGAPGERKAEKKKETPPPPAPKKKKPRIYDSKQVTEKPKCLKKVAPRYPDRALDWNVEGRVVLMAVFDEEGNVKSVEALSDLGCGLEEACIDAVKKSRYAPAVLDGRPVPCKMKMTFNFKLE